MPALVHADAIPTLLDAVGAPVSLWALAEPHDPASLRLDWINLRAADALPRGVIGRSIREVLPDLAPALLIACAEVARGDRTEVVLECNGRPARVIALSPLRCAIVGRETPGTTDDLMRPELEARLAGRTEALAQANAALERQIADRQRTEAALRQAEERLRHAQKMEAIGRLAGGIAHDFNNLLSIILGCTNLLLEQLASGDPNRESVEAIQHASGRAATLTRQLLAFGRRQILAPRNVDLREVMQVIGPLLRRLMPSDVELVIELEEKLPPIHVDASEIEHVIVNLAVNARDAMPGGGTITIAARTVAPDPRRLDDDERRQVMLSIRDTGVGMSPETRARIFEPFFTTKDVGKGTGLGLPMVLGVVEQSGGTVEVTSELGRGSTFTLYLPAARGEAQSTPRSLSTPPRGTETILLVEDDPGVRALAKTLLERLGYRVLAAADADEATALAETTAAIHLLLTDVVMPGRGGPELAHDITRLRPDVRVVFMSGYTTDTIVRHGVIEDRVAFIQKPLDLSVLASTVRRVLDG